MPQMHANYNRANRDIQQAKQNRIEEKNKLVESNCKKKGKKTSMAKRDLLKKASE